MNEEIILTLLNIPRVSRKTVNSILSNVEKISLDEEDIIGAFEKCREKNKKIPVINKETIKKAKNVAKLLIEECKKEGISIITILDKEFPKRLKVINDNPVILFYKGNKSCLDEEKAVAIIGTRNPSEHGVKIASRLGYLFGKDKYVVVSGLAKGCDEFAHKGCVEAKGRSVAVMPCGLDSIYPASNKKLAESILREGGCLVSEYPLGTKLYKNLFVDRDRIQSGLSAGVVVVEASENSGTMHTVSFAEDQEKVIGCYKHKDSFKDKDLISGNIKMLNTKGIFNIDSSESLDIFKRALNSEN